MVSICIFRPTTVYGRLVHVVSGDTYSHCAIRHPVRDVDVQTEAHPVKGVWAANAVYCADPAWQFNLWWVESAWATNYLAAHWGQGYGYRDILSFLMPKRWTRQGHTGLTCSELVVNFLLASFVACAPPDSHAKLVQRLRARVPRTTRPQQVFDDLSATIGQ
jgi:hypothetical protein